MNPNGRWLNIYCFKHNGTLHRCWDRGLVLENNDDIIVVATKKAKVIERNGRRWFTKEPAVTIFSKREWWNAICMLKKEGICYYCNIASPSVIDGDSIKYIDYDLDAKLFPSGEIRLLDQREYLHHKEKYDYSEELDRVLKYTLDKIVALMKKREFPFDNQTIQDYYEKFTKSVAKE